MDNWREVNRDMWDERVPHHLASAFYDVAGFQSGRPQLLPFEVEEIGSLDAARVVHLQCHIGLDTLDLARLHPTATVAGLDFSAPAVDAARSLAESSRLQDRTEFAVGDVFDAAQVLGEQSADVVYTGKGALEWLPDMERWAATVHSLLKPGGFLYLCEFHPVVQILADDEPRPAYDYFRTEPWVWEESGSYADRRAPTVHNRSVGWQHPLERVIGALLRAGLHLQLFHEWNVTVCQAFPWLQPHPEDRRLWTWPGPGSLPLMYSLKAFKPPA